MRNTYSNAGSAQGIFKIRREAFGRTMKENVLVKMKNYAQAFQSINL